VRLAVVILGGWLAGCAGLDTRLPDIGSDALRVETETQQGIALEEMQRLTKRLSAVNWRMGVANAGLCPRVRDVSGFSTRSVKDMDKALREGAIREMGLTEEPTVWQVAEGSPAEAAGIEIGDRILIDGEVKGVRDKRVKAAVEAGRLRVRKADGREVDVTIETVPVCDYAVTVSMSPAINAYATGRSVTVTSGMMNFVQSDDELALIVGHELAHNTMGHIRKIVGNYILSLGGTRYTRPFESEADYVGLYYLARAGYEMEGVEDFWRRLAKVSAKGTTRAKTHPTSSERFLRIAAARDEILAKRAAGEALVPNFKDDDR